MGNDRYRQQLSLLFAYIERYWKLSVEQLATVPFDLEACYTLLELQAADAWLNGDEPALRRLLEINYRLTILLAEYLSEFETFVFNSASFLALGRIIYTEKPAVITFNYDTLLESVIESASGVNINPPQSYRGAPPDTGEVPDDELSYNHHVWNRPLAYGVQFDEVQLHRAGLTTFVPGTRFYSHPNNPLYRPPILKLHGSINWFKYTGLRSYPNLPGLEQEPRKGKTILYEGHWWFNQPAELGGEIIEPVIITPILHKVLSTDSLIRQMWSQALAELSACKRLVVGGYSFSPTDFHTRRLFLEAFVDKVLHEIVVINPDTSVVGVVKDLCHFRKPVVVCRDLDEFISLYPG